MNYNDQLKGMGIALVATLIGMFIFVSYFSELSFQESLYGLYHSKKLGSLISIGALLNLPLFFVLIRKRAYSTAYGVVSVLFLLVALIAILKFI